MSNLNTTKSNSGILEEQKEGANTGNDISAANIKASKVIDKRIEQNRGGTKDLEYGVNQDADEIEGKENGETYSKNENHAKELVNGLDFSENKKENTCKEDAEIALKNKLADNCSNRPLSDKMGQENARTEPYKDHDEDIGEIREGDERYDRQHKLEKQNLATTAQSFNNGIKSSQETRREAQGEYNEVHKSQEMEDEDWVDVLEGGDNMDNKDKDKVKKRKISEHDDKAMEEDKETKAKKKNKEAKEKKEKDKKDKKDKDKKKIKDKEKNKDKKKDGKEYDVDRLKQKLEKIDYKMSKLMAKKADYLRKLDHALQKKLVEAEAVVSTKDSLLKGVEELGAKISELNVAAN